MWQGKPSKNTAWQQSTHAGNGRKRIMGCQEKMQVTFWHITYGAKTWSCIPHQQTFSIRLQTVLLLAYLNKHISTETPNCYTSHIQVNRRCAHPKHQPVVASLACRPIDTANQREISWMNRIAKCCVATGCFYRKCHSDFLPNGDWTSCWRNTLQIKMLLQYWFSLLNWNHKPW